MYMYKYTNKSYLNNAFNTTHDMQSNTKTNKAYNNITLIFKKENQYKNGVNNLSKPIPV